jgi:hypothetical protein
MDGGVDIVVETGAAAPSSVGGDGAYLVSRVPRCSSWQCGQRVRPGDAGDGDAGFSGQQSCSVVAERTVAS